MHGAHALLTTVIPVVDMEFAAVWVVFLIENDDVGGGMTVEGLLVRIAAVAQQPGKGAELALLTTAREDNLKQGCSFMQRYDPENGIWVCSP